MASAALPFGPRRTELVIVLLVAVLVAGLAGCFTRWMRRSVRREPRRWLLTALAGVIAVGAGYLSFVPADAAVYARSTRDSTTGSTGSLQSAS